MKLKTREIKGFRERTLEAQSGCCRLCGMTVTDDAVLDHDHATGAIRGVLHRGCNALLGKIENNMARNRVDMARLAAISNNLITYLTADPVTELLHPTYLTKEERKMKAYKKKKKPVKPGKGRY